MVTYIVFTRESTRDASELETYSQNVGPTLAGHPVTVLAAYGRQKVLEGSEVEGVVILEFPSFDEAKAWYDSPAYREVREHRFRGAHYRVGLQRSVEKSPPAASSALSSILSRALDKGNRLWRRSRHRRH